MSKEGEKQDTLSNNMPNHTRLQGVDGVVQDVRGEVVQRHTVISSALGVILTFSVWLTESRVFVLIPLLAVLICYYYLVYRKGSLKGLSDGSISYFTEDLDKQVVRIKNYKKMDIKNELFSYGVTNIILVELLGTALNATSNLKYKVIYALISLGLYGVFYYLTVRKYSRDITQEIKTAIEEYNTGMVINLTDDEKTELKTHLQIDDRMFLSVNEPTEEGSSVPEADNSKTNTVKDENKEMDKVNDQYIEDKPEVGSEHRFGKFEIPKTEQPTKLDFTYASQTVTTSESDPEQELGKSESAEELGLSGLEEGDTEEQDSCPTTVPDTTKEQVLEEEILVEGKVNEPTEEDKSESIGLPQDVHELAEEEPEIEEGDIFDEVKVLLDVETTLHETHRKFKG